MRLVLLLCFLYAIPYFWILSFKTSFALTELARSSLVSPLFGQCTEPSLGTLFAESFSANVRYTGVSLGYQVGAALVGGPAPLIATAILVKNNNSYIGIGIFIMAAAVISFIAILLLQV